MLAISKGNPKQITLFSHFLTTRTKDFQMAKRSMSLNIVSTEDPEVLVVAHVSNVMYWWNLQTGANSDEYLGETTDIISPGGIALIAEYTTIPIFKSNPEAESDHSIQIDISAVQGETGTGYEPAANKGPFSCANCEFFRSVDNSCGQDDMLKKSKQPRTSDGRIKVDPNACCEYVARVGNGK
jgi:hypothetical protein